MKRIKEYLLIFAAVVSAYTVVTIPNLVVEKIIENRIVTTENASNVSKEVTELEPSEEVRSLSNVPEVSVQWEELKTLVEDSEGSEKASDEVTLGTFVYFDVPLSEDLQSHIFEQCEAVGLEPEIVIAVISKESSFKSDAIGDSGRSFGLMQIQPKWYSERMKELGCDDLLDPYDNVTVGIDILANLLEMSEDNGKSIEWVLMAYNGGTGYADTLTAEGRVSDYAKTVLSVSEELEVVE